MNVLHISDLHFGPRHWEANDKILLKKINSFDTDIVINTGDNTTDGMEDEYVKAGRFLKALKGICIRMNYSENIFTILKSSIFLKWKKPRRNICF